MFLKSLKIENHDELIREVFFHKGLNLIVDETKSKDQTESGNNVGKTTILRLIDFCLGSDGENIFKDKEFRDKTNNEIENFLTQNNITITLTLKDNLDVDSSDEVEIKRNFLKRQEKILLINGKECRTDLFDSTLKKLIFKTEVNKPTFRQIIAKNIRYEKNTLNNTVKVLHSFTTKEEYEALFLFWLGIELDGSARKQTLQREKKIEENLQKRLRKDSNLSQIEQSLIVINRSISELEEKRTKLDYNEEYDVEINSLNLLKVDLNKSSTLLSTLELRKELILESKSDLENEYSKIDLANLGNLYKEASQYIDKIQKTFEETLEFHNKMIQERLKYITKELPDLEPEIQDLKTKIQSLSQNENILIEKIKKKDLMESLSVIVSELNKSYEQKGALEESKKLWEESDSKLQDIEQEIDEINQGIRSKEDLINDKLSKFNEYFSDISYKLYKEKFILSSDFSDGAHFGLNISSIGGNLGTGKKKGQIAAFDLSYIQFADDQDIECLHFIMHDQLENVHDNQLNLLLKIVYEINCQYIVPILRDKLPQELNSSEYEIVSLSQSNKLFKVS